MILSSSDLENIEQAIIDVQNNGRDIRKIFASYYTDEVNINWEVDAAVRDVLIALDNRDPRGALHRRKPPIQ